MSVLGAAPKPYIRPEDIVGRLREGAVMGFGGLALTPGLLTAAADELERQGRELHRLKSATMDRAQYNEGYAQAQRDMRSALGIEE